MKLTLIDQNTAVVGSEEYTAKATDTNQEFCKGCSFHETCTGCCNIDGAAYCSRHVRDDGRNIIWVKKDSIPQPIKVSKKRPHADLIKAWADGAEIEYFNPRIGKWLYMRTPEWGEDDQYRIMQKDIVHQIYVNADGGISTTLPANIQVTFDAQTGQIKSVNIL